MKKISKKFWIFLGISAVFFLVMIIISAVLDLGEKLRNVHPYVEYAFYGVSAILFIILFIRPLFLIIFAPSFSLDELFSEEENAKKNYSMYKKVAKNLLEEDLLSNEEKQKISDSLNDVLELKKTLSNVFDETIKKELNKMIISHAETVFLSTAISQNDKLDAIAVITINQKLFKNLIINCRFILSYYSIG